MTAIPEPRSGVASPPVGVLPPRRRQLLSAGWPIAMAVAGYPVWWALGLTPVVFPLGAIPMFLKLRRRGNIRVPPGFCCMYRWLVESDRVLGGIALRDGSSDYILWAGHIGYGIRPSARRRGLATWAMAGVAARPRQGRPAAGR